MAATFLIALMTFSQARGQAGSGDRFELVQVPAGWQKTVSSDPNAFVDIYKGNSRFALTAIKKSMTLPELRDFLKKKRFKKLNLKFNAGKIEEFNFQQGDYGYFFSFSSGKNTGAKNYSGWLGCLLLDEKPYSVVAASMKLEELIQVIDNIRNNLFITASENAPAQSESSTQESSAPAVLQTAAVQPPENLWDGWLEGQRDHITALTALAQRKQSFAVYIREPGCPKCGEFEKNVLANPAVREFLKPILKVRLTKLREGSDETEEDLMSWGLYQKEGDEFYGDKEMPRFFVNSAEGRDISAQPAGTEKTGNMCARAPGSNFKLYAARVDVPPDEFLRLLQSESGIRAGTLDKSDTNSAKDRLISLFMKKITEYQNLSIRAKKEGRKISAWEALRPLFGFFLILFFLSAFPYVFYSLTLYKIAAKTSTPHAWFAWIPFLYPFLILMTARISLWYVPAYIIFFIIFNKLGLIIAISTTCISFIILYKICLLLRRPSWIAALYALPYLLYYFSQGIPGTLVAVIVPLVCLGYLAFSKTPEDQYPAAGAIRF